jgi:hypothetical protein
LISLELAEETHSWRELTPILNEKYFRISNNGEIYLKEIKSNSKLNGVVLVGEIDILVDTVVYTQSQGAFGETLQFIGSSLVILGVQLKDFDENIRDIILPHETELKVREKAEKLLKKVKNRINDDSVHLEIGEDPEVQYIIYGLKDFFLVGSTKNIVLIHKKQISVRTGENNLVQVDPENGVTIVNKEKCLRVKGPSTESSESVLGEIGVSFASKILETFIWD